MSVALWCELLETIPHVCPRSPGSGSEKLVVVQCVFFMSHLVRLFLRISYSFSEKSVCLVFPGGFASDSESAELIVTKDQQ